MTLDDVTRLEGTLLGSLCNLVSSLRCLLVLSRRRFFGKTFLLHLVRLFDGKCHSRCRSSRFLPSRFSSANSSTHEFCQGRTSGEFLFSRQYLFDAVPGRTTDGSQGGRFTRGNGGRDECQERKESTPLTSFATTTHGPSSASSSSTFGRHDVFDAMKGTRCRHAHLAFFSVYPPPLATRPPPPPPPPTGSGLGAQREERGDLPLTTSRSSRLLLLMRDSGRMTCHPRTSSIFVRGGDGIGRRDTRNATSAGRLYLIVGQHFQLTSQFFLRYAMTSSGIGRGGRRRGHVAVVAVGTSSVVATPSVASSSDRRVRGG